MKISEIYKKYNLPINLQQHMYRVGGVAALICENISGLTLNKEAAIKAALFHDLGNILKMDFDAKKFLVASDIKRVDQLKEIKKNFTKKYGSNCDQATLQMIKEITNDQFVYDICATSYIDTNFTREDNWELKILHYSDIRVGPLGLVSLYERFKDLAIRYPNYKHFQENQRKGILIEEQIQQHLPIDLQKITNKQADQYQTQLEQIEIT